MRSANFTPAAEALREPTIAINGCFSTSSLPPQRDDVDHLQARWIVGPRFYHFLALSAII
jgi:hypothetical protein